MTELPQNIGTTVKSVRQQMGLSLDKAAALTGVSKAMLGQIERGESSPTVSTLWKISSGLRITFSRLLGSAEAHYTLRTLADIPPVPEDGGRMVLHNIFPFDPVTGFDYFQITLLPGCDYASPGHNTVYEEHILVTQGKLVLRLEGQDIPMQCGDSIKFKGELQHAYRNPFDTDAIFQNIMKYL